MRKYLYAILLIVSFPALKTNAQCNGWVPLGTFDSIQASFDSVSYTAIAAPNNKAPFIVYADAMVGGKVSVVTPTITGRWTFDGKEGFSAGPVQYTAIAIGKGGKPYVAYVDLSTAKNRVKVRYNSSPNVWTLAIGTNNASAASASYVSLAVDTNNTTKTDSVYVAYADASDSNKLTVMKFKSPNWVSVGPKDFSHGGASYISLKIYNNTPYVAYSDSSYGYKATVLEYTGGAWVAVPGLPVTASTGAAAFNSLAFDNTGKVYLAFQDLNAGGKGNLVTPTGLVIKSWATPVGASPYLSDAVSDISMCFDGAKYLNIVYNDNKTGHVNAAAFNTALLGTFSVLGNADFSAGAGRYCGITTVNMGGGGPIPFVVYQDAKAGAKATGMALSVFGTNIWSYIFSPTGISPNVPPVEYGYDPTLIASKGKLFVAYEDGDSNKTSVMTYNGATWGYIGTRGIVSGKLASRTPQIVSDPANNIYVAYQGDSVNRYHPYLKKLNGTGNGWLSVGAAGGLVDTCRINYISMTIGASNNPYVIYDDSKNAGRATAKYYNGASWLYAGSSTGFSPGAASYISSAYYSPSNTLYTVFSDGNNSNNALLFSYSGSSWNNVGMLSGNGAAYNSLAIDNSGTPYVAFQDLSTKGVFVGYWTGGLFQLIGNSPVFSGSATNISLKFDSLYNLYLSFNDGTNNNKLTVMEYSNSLLIWGIVGNAGISKGEIEGNTSLAFAGITPYVAYQDRGADVQKFTSAPPSAKVTVTPAYPIVCPGTTVTLTASGGANYKWSNSTSSTTSSITVTPPSGTTTYYVSSVLGVGCPADTASATVNVNTADNDIYTVVGNGYNATSGYGGYTGDGGPTKSAELAIVTGIAFNTGGDTMYVADQQNGVIRRVIMKTGIISTIAGNYGINGNYSGDGGPATAAGMYWPSGIAMYKGNLYIADQVNNVIREVNLKTNIITTVAGNGYGAGSTTGGGYSGDGGQATAAELSFPTGLTFDNNGNMFIADYQNNLVREVNTLGIISTFAGIPNNFGYTTSGGAANASLLGFVASVAFDKTYSTLYLANQGYSLIQKINMATGKLYTVAGDTVDALANNQAPGYSGDGGPAKAAVLNKPIGVTVDGPGNIYIADEQNNRIREITTNGIINTIAGSGTPPNNFGYSGDGGPATSAVINLPWAVTLDPAGNIYIPDNYNNVVREIKVCSSATVTISTLPDTICPHGSTQLTATVSGGTPPYTYAWSNGATSSTITVSPLATTVYTVTVTESTSLTTTDTTRVTVLTTSIKTSSAHDTICSGIKDTLTAKGGKPTSYRWSPATRLSATTGASVVATFTAAGTFTYTVTDTTVKGCIDTAKVIIRVNPTPTLIVTPNAPTICNGTSTSLTASGATSYTWAPSVSVTPPTGTPVTATPTVTTTYTVLGTTSVGCSAKDSVTVTVTPSPTVTVNATKRTICIGDTTTLTAASNPSTGITYTWSPAKGLNATTGIKVVASPTITTTYTVTGSNLTCSDTAIITINAVPTPTLSITSTATSICSGNSTTIKVGGGATTYTWAPSASLTPPTGTSVNATPTTTTTYTVIGSSGSCSAKDSIIINVSQPFTITASATPTTMCSGATTSLSASSSATSYTWAPSASLNSSTSANVTATPTISTTYTVTGVNGACSSTATISVTVTPFPSTINTSSSPVTCNGFCNGIAAVSVSGLSTYTYIWSNSTSGTTTSITNACAGNYTVTVTDANGCKGSGAVTVTQPTALVGSITSTNSCTGGNIGTATVNASGGISPYTYSWSSGQTTSTISGLAAGSYSDTITDKNGCTLVSSVTILQSSQMSDSIVASSVIDNKCAGNTNGSATVGVKGGTMPYTYSWSPSGGATATASNLADGTYSCIVTDASGCNANATASVTITSPPALTVNNDDTAICGGMANLYASASGGTPGYTYTWDNTTIGSTYTASPTITTTYTIVVADKNGCKTTMLDIVSIGNTVTQNVSAKPNPGCAGQLVTIIDSVTGGNGNYTYNWYEGTNLIGNTQSVAVHPITTSTYQVTSCCNCDGSTLTGNVTVTVKPAPIFTVCCDSNISAGQSVQLKANPSSYVYDWTPSAGLNCVTCFDPVATPTVSTTYFVTSADTSDGCISIDSVTITVGSGSLVFYHGITPNGDGHNDTWVIDNIETFDNTSVGIYNRWGNEVWSATNYNNTTIVWKGDDATGKPLPDATYFYIVKVNGTTYKGWVQLTR